MKWNRAKPETGGAGSLAAGVGQQSRRQVAAVLFCAVVVFGITFFQFFPGAIDFDGVSQLSQARAHEYVNHHPPLMAFLWHFFLGFQDGPGGMLLLHMLMLYGGSFLLFLWSFQKRFLGSWLFMLIPVLPWIINFEFAIIKDTGMAYAWYLSLSLAVYYSGRAQIPKWVFWAAGILFVYGVLVRANAIFAAVLLLPFLTACLFGINTVKSFVWLTVLNLAAAAVLPKAFCLAIGAKPANQECYMMFDDIVALRLRGVDTGRAFLDSQDILSFKESKEYMTHQVGAAYCILEKYTGIKNNRHRELRSEWIKALRNNFSLYLQYRMEAFISLIRSPWLEPFHYNEFRVPEYPQHRDSRIQPYRYGSGRIVQFVELTARLIPGLFKPYFWILAALTAAVIMKRKYPGGLPFWMLPMSGVTYAAGYYPLTPMPDFRYVYWLVLMTTVSFVICLILPAGRGRAKPEGTC